jgi:cyclophilin family peptidyl-prolyl cis-trans isomerase
MKAFGIAGFVAIVVLGLGGQAVPAQGANPVVVLETSAGNITVELFRDKAPRSVENFLAYAKAGFYKGTVFHRVIKGFMIQGGGLTAALERKPTQAPIANEAANGLKNTRGTLAMARTAEVNSATSQFFINTADNPRLDHRDESPQGFGYAVFGAVIDGMAVVDKIELVATTAKGGHQNVPAEPITITAARIKTP